MDQPPISTLPDEYLSAPGAISAKNSKIATVKFRLSHQLPATGSSTGNIIVLPAAGGAKPRAVAKATVTGADEGEEDELAEEDGEEDDGRAVSVSSTAAPPVKRKSRLPRAPGSKPEKRKRETREPMLTSPTDPAPLMTTFDLAAPDEYIHREVSHTGSNWDWSLHSADGGSSSMRGRKKGAGAARKNSTAPTASSSVSRVKKNPSKLMSSMPFIPMVPPVVVEDEPDDVSEVLEDDATSSPLLAPSIMGMDADIDSLTTPLEELDAQLGNTPQPVYPLPSRPFSVLPPAKIGSGNATIYQLNRGGPPVRRWRTVMREVRGVAGGRWFARSWLGEKDSPLANAQTAGQTPAVNSATPTPAAGVSEYQFMPPSTTSKRGRGRGRGGALSAGSSRQASNGPDTPSGHVVRAPTKMRTSVVAGEGAVGLVPEA